MMNPEIYAAFKEYIEDTLNRLAGGVPDSSLKVEISEGDFGEEWTGIRMSKLPTAALTKGDIAGGGIVDYAFQIVSQQAVERSDEAAIAYSTYLERLAFALRERFRSGDRPELPEGSTLRNVKALQQSTLQHTDARYSGYVLDLRFTVKTRRI